MMNCQETLERLHDVIDDTLPENERQAFLAHVAECDSCRNEYAFMESILAETAQLPASIAPEHDLWAGIASKLGEQEPPSTLVAFPKRSIVRWAPLAAIAALLLLMATIQSDQPSDPVAPEVATHVTALPETTTPEETEIMSLEAEYAQARTTLMNALDERKNELPADLMATIEENLNIIENAVVDINRAIADNPENPELERMLHAAYQSEVTLLQTVVTMDGDES
jgi:hypothetical protein